SDHQQLIMTVLKQKAKKHGFMCLLHEKPFAGINGSGKHINWSVGNATQGNLLDPGDSPHENAQFLLFCGAVIRGVHQYGPLMRAAIATASNDHRLGANEAPPAIMSVYLGTELEEIFEQIKTGTIAESRQKGVMDIGVDVVPQLTRDAGDRNRTSPFAFTGNRFEFRAVGSNQSVSGPLIVLNTMLADSLDWVGNQLENELNKGTDIDTAILTVLKKVMEQHSAVIFGGNGYSEEWQKMAVEERGLLNLPTTADALPVLKQELIEDLFKKTGVLTSVELESRFEVYAEQYILSIEVEARLMVKMAKTMIYPAAMEYLSQLSSTISNLTHLNITLETDNIQKIANLTNSIVHAISDLETALEQDEFANTEEKMQHCANTLLPIMNELREKADHLEGEVADRDWPLPSYQEMLFIK
ncbi:MAG: glutamine synthetase type III, partial [Halothece sp. Uz-M2-17]|nr:glutamine synthetase type III [Halothece sp. Uz-M2-17]